MLQYTEFKEFLINRVFKMNATDVMLPQLTFETNSFRGRMFVTISDHTLLEAYNKVSGARNNDLELFLPVSYEVAIDTSSRDINRRVSETSVCIEDNDNGIKYILSPFSFEYCIFILIELATLCNDVTTNRRDLFSVFMKLRRGTGIRTSEDDEIPPIPLEQFLPQSFSELSLKVITEDAKGYIKLKESANAFLFNFMYKTDASMIEFKNIQDLLRFNRHQDNNSDLAQFDAPPLRVYNRPVLEP